MLEVLDLERFATVAKVDLVPGRARRRDGGHFVERELALGEDVQDLAPDIARRPDDRDPISHCSPLSYARAKGGEVGVRPEIVNAQGPVTFRRLAKGESG